jgi:hypothetical protein
MIPSFSRSACIAHDKSTLLLMRCSIGLNRVTTMVTTVTSYILRVLMQISVEIIYVVVW